MFEDGELVRRFVGGAFYNMDPLPGIEMNTGNAVNI